MINFTRLRLYLFYMKKILNRLILLLASPIILINVVCAILIIIKNWSLRNTKEVDV